MTYSERILEPDALLVQDGNGWAAMRRADANRWTYEDIEAHATPVEDGLAVSLTAKKSAVLRLAVVWKVQSPPGARMMCDNWERGYGDLEWRGIIPQRVMPWFFLLFDGARTHGFGVMTSPKALCFWQVNEDAITLCLDVRCGGMGVRLNGRRIELATVVARDGLMGESPFGAAKAFCRLMCPAPVLPAQPVYGGNNWYYAYGKSSHGEIAADAEFISSLAPSTGNRPFMVIDMGWEQPLDTAETSLWQNGNNQFPDMRKLAGQMKNAGTRPGIWVRPLSVPDNCPESLCLPQERVKPAGKLVYPGRYLDPSIPEALELVRLDVAWQAEQGYELIKHDFTTFDLLGRWGFEMGGELTNGGWRFNDATKTTAEVVGDLYRAIRRGAGSAAVIGCNTVGHLCAGLFELQRTGDDTSGRQWERTRKMGVNTLAFTLPKHGAFYAVDADCAGITDAVPWELSRQWLDLLARSGTPLFVSAHPSVGPEQRKAIREAFVVASEPIPAAEPLDWMETTCPRKWLLNGNQAKFRWDSPDRIEFCD